MGGPRLRQGTIGSVTWDERSPGTVRGTAFTLDGGGKRRRLTATRSTREEAVTELEAQAAALVYAGEVWSTQTTLGETIERWIAALESEPTDEAGQKEQSVETYARTARGVVVPRLGAIPLGDLTTPRLQTFMDDLRIVPHQRNGKAKTGYSVSYRLLILMTVRESLALAVRSGAITSNPALNVDKPSKKARKRKKPKQALTPAQVAVLRECVVEWEVTRRSGPKRGPQLRLAIELGLATGCRIGEVVGFLLQEAVDVPTLRIAVTGTAVTVKGKVLRADELKGREQARVLELPSWVRPTLDECRGLATRTGVDAPLLQGRSGVLVSPSNLQNRMRAMREEHRERLEVAGVDVDELTFHTLRRTVLTAVDGVVGRPLSQAQAGHKDARTTAGYIDAVRPLLVVTGTVGAIESAFGCAS